MHHSIISIALFLASLESGDRLCLPGALLARRWGGGVERTESSAFLVVAPEISGFALANPTVQIEIICQRLDLSVDCVFISIFQHL